jgi:hypothetical protein
MKSKICILLLSCAGWLTSCTLSNDFDIEVPVQVPAIVIEGYINPEYPVQVTITRNNLLDDELILQSIWNARVLITDKRDTLNLLNMFYKNKERNVLVNYTSNSFPGVFQGDSLYLMVVTTTGDTLTGKTRIVSGIAIEDTKIENNVLYFNKKILNGDFTGYLRIDETAYKADTVYSSGSEFIEISASASDRVQMNLASDLVNADSIRVKVFHITDAYYNYLVSVLNATSAYEDPFLTPEEIKSDITHGIGIFTYYTCDSAMVYPIK